MWSDINKIIIIIIFTVFPGKNVKVNNYEKLYHKMLNKFPKLYFSKKLKSRALILYSE